MQRRQLLNGSTSVWVILKTIGCVNFEFGASELLSSQNSVC